LKINEILRIEKSEKRHIQREGGSLCTRQARFRRALSGHGHVDVSDAS